MNSEPSHARRALLKALLSAAATLSVTRLPAAIPAPPTSDTNAAAAASAHYPFGPVIPARAFPALPLRTQFGRTVDAREWLRGHVTAVQLMFTGCSATCPIQGAIFAAAQRHLATDLPKVRFVSLSIDPVADTPAALTAWLAQFDATNVWAAAAPRVADVQEITTLLRGDAALRSGTRPRPTDAHTAQVYFLDRDARLVLRTADFPSAQQVASELRRLVAS